MTSLVRRAKYALAAPVLDAALATFPQLSRRAPPHPAINISGSGAIYIENGENAARQLVAAGPSEGQTVIEIGMGMGGNALMLWRRFGDRINLSGFDIVRFAVTWTRQHFRQLGSSYKFTHADVFNSFYNPFGKTQPDKYVFPYADASADLIFANSVFTHMQEREVIHYFAEAARTLKPGGRAWFTFFLLDDHSAGQIEAGATPYSFRLTNGNARYEDPIEPDRAVAYSPEWVMREMAAAGLSIQKIERGWWRGVGDGYYQDIVVAERR